NRLGLAMQGAELSFNLPSCEIAVTGKRLWSKGSETLAELGRRQRRKGCPGARGWNKIQDLPVFLSERRNLSSEGLSCPPAARCPPAIVHGHNKWFRGRLCCAGHRLDDGTGEGRDHRRGDQHSQQSQPPGAADGCFLPRV